jgi:hypothetical protein
LTSVTPTATTVAATTQPRARHTTTTPVFAAFAGGDQFSRHTVRSTTQK